MGRGGRRKTPKGMLTNGGLICQKQIRGKCHTSTQLRWPGVRAGEKRKKERKKEHKAYQMAQY